MARIKPQLLERLEDKLELSRSRVYQLIDQAARNQKLPRNLAAIALAAQEGINISKFATEEDLAILRQSAPRAPDIHTVTVPAELAQPRRGRAGSRREPRSARRGTSVFVVHGRNEAITRSLFNFLRSIGLEPIEWNRAIATSRKAAPYVGEILDTAFRQAVAVVVLFTPDDLAKLDDALLRPTDPTYERELTGQARPNVLFEAGMAFGRNPNSTVLVQVGMMRPFSDIGGRHVVHLTERPESRQEQVTKLANAGCNVNLTGTHWLSEGDFKAREKKSPGKR